MVRALPSAVPPKMYRHFALVTVLLTAGIAMFAEGENREAFAAQVNEHDEQEAFPRESAIKPPKPAIARSAAARHERFVQSGGFDGFDPSFGAPMERALGSFATDATNLASGGAQAGYSEGYLASLSPQERDLLLKGLEKEGLLSPEERERKSAALIAASQTRSGASPASH